MAILCVGTEKMRNVKYLRVKLIFKNILVSVSNFYS